jgi:hypothetical protein
MVVGSAMREWRAAARFIVHALRSRTSAPPFERRHQKSNMRQNAADPVGLPPVTSGGAELNRNLSYRNLRLYIVLIGNSRQLRPTLRKQIILKLADNGRSGQPAI